MRYTEAMKNDPGPRQTAEWRHYGEQWKKARQLSTADVPLLQKVGQAAAQWARRNGKRAEYRIREDGRVLWLRMVDPSVPKRGSNDRWNNPDEPD